MAEHYALSSKSFGNTWGDFYVPVYYWKSRIVSLVVKGKFAQPSENLKILWTYVAFWTLPKALEWQKLSNKLNLKEYGTKQETFTKIFRQTPVFIGNSALREKFKFSFQRALLVLATFSFRGITEQTAIILWSLDIFLLFPIFLRSEVLSRIITCVVTCIYQFNNNNHALFQLRWKKNLLNLQKVSKFYFALNVFINSFNC